MPTLSVSSLNQKAVLWPVGEPDRSGRTQVGSRSELSVRWEQGIRQVVSSDNQNITADAVVDVDRKVEIGGIIRLGALDSVPGNPDNLFRVIDYQEVPSINGLEVQRTILLTRWNDQLPGGT